MMNNCNYYIIQLIGSGYASKDIDGIISKSSLYFCAVISMEGGDIMFSIIFVDFSISSSVEECKIIQFRG